MKIVYDKHQEVYLVALEESETVTLINTKDIVEARESFLEQMKQLFNCTICKELSK